MGSDGKSDWSLLVTFAEDYADVNVPDLPSPQREDHTALYRFDHRRYTSSELIQQLLPRYRITDIEVRRPPLEDTIRRIYEERLLPPSA